MDTRLRDFPFPQTHTYTHTLRQHCKARALHHGSVLQNSKHSQCSRPVSRNKPYGEWLLNVSDRRIAFIISIKISLKRKQRVSLKRRRPPTRIKHGVPKPERHMILIAGSTCPSVRPLLGPFQYSATYKNVFHI